VNIDQQTCEQLRSLTEDVVGGPDLDRVLRDGRRRRRSQHRRTALTGVAALAVTGVVAGAAYQHGHGSSRQATDGSSEATAPAYHDFVPGTDTDEKLQAAVADDLPALGDADLVDAWRNEGARQVLGWQRATGWTLRYPTGDQRLWVTVRKPTGYGGVACDDVTHAPDEGQPDCTRVPLPSGGYVVNDSFEGVVHLDDPYFVFASTYVRPDGSSVDVRQEVSEADTWHEAVRDVTLAPDQLTDTLTDPRLDFPDPAS
jgi:hypothetical protein